MTKQSYRLMFKFWLDMTKADEEGIADIIEKLKSARAFSAAVRDGLRLIWDLRQGKIDVLLELFPFVKAAIAERMDYGSGKGSISKADLERLESLILQNQVKEVQMQSPAPATMGGLQPLGGIKQLAAPPLPPPSDDDDDKLAVTKAVGSGSASDNFINALGGLQKPRR